MLERALVVTFAAGAIGACATILDFPDRVLDTADAKSGATGGVVGGGGTPTTGGSGGLGGNQAGSGGSISTGGADADATYDATPDVSNDAISEKGPDPDSGDAGPPNPGEISCGAQNCSVNAGDVCCIDPKTETRTCVVANACPSTSLKQFCDEPTDCLSGEICCATVGDGMAKVFPAQCQASCNSAGEVPLCKSDTECSIGMCKLRLCSGGTIIEACKGCP